MIRLYKIYKICIKLKLKIKFRHIFSYISNIYIYFIKNKNLIVSWYYDTIPRYDTADKKMILPSIPILKTLPVAPLRLLFGLLEASVNFWMFGFCFIQFLKYFLCNFSKTQK
jgi:hypothetical protein